MSKRLSWTLVMALLAAAAWAQPGPKAGVFFRPAPDKSASLPADQVFPKGRVFPFGFYSIHGLAATQQAKKDGVTLLGPVYGNKDAAVLADAKEAGLPMVHTIGLPKEKVEEGKLTDEEIIKAIREQVEKVKDEKAIAWWNLKPEELRSWRKPEMRYMELAAKTIRDTDPLKRPVWMYDPGHRSAKGLEPSARNLDIVGKGMYTNYSGMKDSRVWCRWSIEQELAAIKAANSKAVPIAVPEMFQQPKDPEDVKLIPAWARHDVYAALVAGAQGVMVFSFAQRKNFEARDAYYAAYAQVAAELTGKLDLGRVFLFGERRDDLALSVTAGPDKVSMVFPSGGVKEPITYPSVSMANLALGADRTLVLVNSAAQPVELMVEGLPYGRTMVQDLLAGKPEFVAPEGDFPVELPPLGVKVFRIRWDGGKK